MSDPNRSTERIVAVALLCLASALVQCADGDREERLPLPVGPAFYFSDTIHSTVADQRTGEPIEGAVVVAVWRNVDTHTEQWKGIFRVAETTSDAKGRFTIARWGPRVPPTGAFLDSRDPEIWVVRRGYLVGYFDNSGESKPMMPKGLEAPRYVKLPPAKTPDSARGSYARLANGGSVWHGRAVSLLKAPSPADAARSLAAANPGEPRLPVRFTPLDLYWREWEKAKALLPPDLQREVPFPPHSLIDYDVISVRGRERS